MPSLAPLLGGLRTTPQDEYGFWNVSAAGVPSAIPPFTLSFSRTALFGHALLCGDEEGVLTILDTRRSLNAQMHASTPSSSPVARFRAHDNAIFDAIWLPGDACAATSSGDATVRVFDVATSFRSALLRGAAGSVKAVRNLPGSQHVLLTAARDGAVRAFDTRVPSKYDPSVSREVFHSPVFTLPRAHERETSRAGATATKRRRIRANPPADQVGSVTSLVFMPGEEYKLFTAGAADGAVKLWDLRGSERRRGTGNLTLGGLSANCIAKATPGLEERCGVSGSRRSKGIASLDIDPSGRHLAVSAAESTVYVYDAGDIGLGHSLALTGHAQTSFYIRARFSPCGRFVMSGSADSRAYIWDLDEYGEDGELAPLVCLEGHRGGETAGVAWCEADPLKVATCGDDATAKVWRVNRGQRAMEAREMGESAELKNGARKVARVRRSKRVEKKIGAGAGAGAVGDGRLVGRKVKAGLPRKRMRNADIRSFFKEPRPIPGAANVSGCEEIGLR